MKFPIITIGYGTYMPTPRIGFGEEPTYFRYDPKTIVNCEDKITIGNYCSISPGVNFMLSTYGADHKNSGITNFPLQAINPLPEHVTFTVKDEIRIGNDVWIGCGVTIMAGVTVGNGAVIAAGSIVTKDVLDYSLVAGNPAVFKKYRYKQEQIQALNRIQWWNWSLDLIKEQFEDFFLPIEEFITKYDLKN